MNDFNFSPPTGLRDVTVYPSEPGSEAAAREQFQGLLDQIRTYINDNFKTPFNAQNIGAVGYQKLPNGLIIQWGQLYVQAGENGSSVTFPITFPNCFLSASVLTSDAANWYAGIKNQANTGMTIMQSYSGGQILCYWTAIGY